MEVFKVALVIICMLSMLCLAVLTIAAYLSITSKSKSVSGLFITGWWVVFPAQWSGIPEEDYPLIFWGRVAYLVFWGTLLLAYFLGPSS